MARQDDIQRLLAVHHRRLQFLKEQQALNGVDTYPSIRIEIEDIEVKIAELDKELASLERSKVSRPPSVKQKPSKTPRRTPVLTWLGGGGLLIILIVGGLWLGSWFNRATKPDLPGDYCQPLPAPLEVAVAQLNNCPIEHQMTLVEVWNSEIAQVTPLEQTFADQNEARAASNYDLVVWGSCEESENNSIQLNFEFTPRKLHKPVEIYEPSSLNVAADLTGMGDVGPAIINYLHGNYAEANALFSRLPSTIIETSSELALLWANSLLYDGRYEEAVEAYDREVLQIWSPAYNNKGVALFNRALLNLEGYPQDGAFEFDQAIELSKAEGQRDITLLAYTNKSNLLRWGGNRRAARTFCEMAQDLNARSALPYICFANYRFSVGVGSKEGIPFDEIDRDLKEAAKYDTVSPEIHFLRGEWLYNQDQAQDAVDAYTTFLKELEYHTCLSADLKDIADSQKLIDELTR